MSDEKEVIHQQPSQHQTPPFAKTPSFEKASPNSGSSPFSRKINHFVTYLTNEMASALEEWQKRVSIRTRNIWVLSLLGIVLLYGLLTLFSLFV